MPTYTNATAQISHLKTNRFQMVVLYTDNLVTDDKQLILSCHVCQRSSWKLRSESNIRNVVRLLDMLIFDNLVHLATWDFRHLEDFSMCLWKGCKYIDR